MKHWKCEVCGYVHAGEEPPQSCPLCGADRSHFSPLQLVAQPTKPTGNRWRCSICDHLHSGAEPPAVCPVCGAAADLFSVVGEEVPLCQGVGGKNILILGTGIAGLTAAEEARKCSSEATITLVGKEAGLPYYRLNLTRFLAGEVNVQELPIYPADWYREQRIELLEGEALQVDCAGQRVQLRDGRTLGYDRLIITNGSHPFVPPIPGATRDGIKTLRTLGDAQEILQRLRPGLKVTCVGGGLLGLETAAALARQGAQVTILEGFPWLMPRQLPQMAGLLLQRHLEGLGVEVRCGAEVEELAGDDHLRSVILADGTEIPAELTIISAGIRPNSWLSRQAQLKVKNGLIVDDRMMTSDPQIFAAGDVAEHRGHLYGIWPAGYAQGVVAGINAAGGEAEFSGISMATRIKVLDVDLFSIGQLGLPDASYRLLEKTDGNNYCGLVCRDNQLLGAALIGDTSLAPVLKEAIEAQVQIPEHPDLQALVAELQATAN